MNSTTSESLLGNVTAGETGSVATDSLATRLHSNTSSASVPDITEVVTKTIGNDTHPFVSSYTPGNDSLWVNATHSPEPDNEIATVKKIVVILTNVTVVVCIFITLFLAFRHRKWQRMMKRKLWADRPSSDDFGLDDIGEGKETNDVDSEDEGEEICNEKVQFY